MTGVRYRPSVRRLCLVVDIESYSTRQARVQADMQGAVDRALAAGARCAGVSRWRIDRQDRGDGALLVLPHGVDEARAIPGFLRGMLTALDDGPADARVRLRVSLTEGVVRVGATGFVGQAVVAACHLVDAEAGRTELRRCPSAAMVVLVEETLFTDVVSTGHGDLPADGFDPVTVTAKGGVTVRARMRTLHPDTRWSTPPVGAVDPVALLERVGPIPAGLVALAAAEVAAPEPTETEPTTPEPAETEPTASEPAETELESRTDDGWHPLALPADESSLVGPGPDEWAHGPWPEPDLTDDEHRWV